MAFPGITNEHPRGWVCTSSMSCCNSTWNLILNKIAPQPHEQKIELSYYYKEGAIRPWCSIVTHIGAKTNLFESLGSDHMLINSQGKLDTVKC